MNFTPNAEPNLLFLIHKPQVLSCLWVIPSRPVEKQTEYNHASSCKLRKKVKFLCSFTHVFIQQCLQRQDLS